MFPTDAPKAGSWGWGTENGLLWVYNTVYMYITLLFSMLCQFIDAELYKYVNKLGYY